MLRRLVEWFARMDKDYVPIPPAYVVHCPEWLTQEEFDELPSGDRLIESVVDDIIRAAKGDLFDKRYLGPVTICLNVCPHLKVNICREDVDPHYRSSAQLNRWWNVVVYSVEVNGYKLILDNLTNHPVLESLNDIYEKWKEAKPKREAEAKNAQDAINIENIMKGKINVN